MFSKERILPMAGRVTTSGKQRAIGEQVQFPARRPISVTYSERLQGGQDAQLAD